MISAVVTFHGYSTTKLVDTLNSIRAVENTRELIITATGYDLATEQWLKRVRAPGKVVKVVLNTNPYSNGAWIAGVAEATQPLTLLIHDGDVVTQEFGDAQFRPDHANIYQAFNRQGYYWIHNKLCLPGFALTHKDIARVATKYNTKTISPVQCVWPTKFLLETLTEFEAYSSNTLLVNHSLVIGNDWYLWHKLGSRNDVKLNVIHQPLVGFDTLGSTTVRADADQFFKLERLYDMCRERCDVKRRKYGEVVNMCYFNTEAVRPLTRAEFASKATLDNVVPFAHFTFPEARDKSKQLQANSFRGSQAFMTMLEYAWCYGYDYLLLTEDDCRLMQEGYDRVMFEDFCKRKTLQTKLYGTPVAWNPRSPGPHFWNEYVKYAADYLKLSGFSLPVEGGDFNGAPSFFANGALAIYDVEFFYHLLIHDAKQDIALVSPWDLVIGYKLYHIYREKVFETVLASKCTHSVGSNWFTSGASKNLRKDIVAWHK